MSLTEAGYDVITAENGFRALFQLRKSQPDILVSDLDMPGMSGFELLSVVRRRFPQISTVAMSGAYVDDMLPFGVVADRFFAKAQPSRNLLITIESLLGSAPARSSEHHRDRAPVWIALNGNGNDSQAMPYVVLTCTECLRAFSMNVPEGSGGEVLEVPCRYCLSVNRYFIQPSSVHV
jgi:DNA-binding response OmpR family regulator